MQKFGGIFFRRFNSSICPLFNCDYSSVNPPLKKNESELNIQKTIEEKLETDSKQQEGFTVTPELEKSEKYYSLTWKDEQNLSFASLLRYSTLMHVR